MNSDMEAIHTKLPERYGLAATGGGCCNGNACCASDYSADELARIPAESVLGLGSGNPVRAADLPPGETVVDLGAGGGIDVFLAASVVGAQGRAIGVDMTPAMVDRARGAAHSPRAPNTSFVLAPIERIPLADNIADVVLSNCVINLSPDKPAVFAEAFRILKPGGRLAISDIVQERDLGKIEDDCGCVATAMVRAEYLNTIRHAGFRELHIAEDRAWRTGPNGVEASAVTLVARKPDGRGTRDQAQPRTGAWGRTAVARLPVGIRLLRRLLSIRMPTPVGGSMGSRSRGR